MRRTLAVAFVLLLILLPGCESEKWERDDFTTSRGPPPDPDKPPHVIWQGGRL
jgi:hypothetical protein